MVSFSPMSTFEVFDKNYNIQQLLWCTNRKSIIFKAFHKVVK